MSHSLSRIVDLHAYPLGDATLSARLRDDLDTNGVVVLHDFIRPDALTEIQAEAEARRHLAFYSTQTHNVYLATPDKGYAATHPRNREIVSSKGCITDDQVDAGSPLRALYDSDMFRDFLGEVLKEPTLHPYADPLSSINVHFADRGQELGWHFDNSSFAVTLLIQKPEGGGDFEFVRHLRATENDDMGFGGVRKVLDGEVQPKKLEIHPGTLVLFRGRNSMHRVTPVTGDRTRVLAVLAYNNEANVSLSESARMTFYGRLE